MLKIRITILFVLVSFCCIAQYKMSRNQRKVFKEVKETLDYFMSQNEEIPSMAVNIVKDGEVIFEYYSGFFDEKKSKKANKNTLYKMSSITKLLISIAIMQQVEEGKVNLDDDISKYVGFEIRNPKFSTRIITVRMLMKHSSSLSNPFPGQTIKKLFSLHDANKLINLEPTIRDILNPKSDIYNPFIWTDHEPGSFFKNSNLGLTLLGYLIEKVTGEHYTAYAKKNILDPMGMNDSALFHPQLNKDNIAILYGRDGSLLPHFNYWFYPIGMLYTSAKDWSKFMLTILNYGKTPEGKQILKRSSFDQITNISKPDGTNQLAFGSNIGLIWREAAINKDWYGHTGNGGGVSHITEMNLKGNIGYLIFTNKLGVWQIQPGAPLNKELHEILKKFNLNHHKTKSKR